VVHNDGTIVTEASSTEWGIKKQLVSTNDRSSAMNVARVLAQRCLESGILAVHCENDASTMKTRVFLEAFEQAGVALQEPQVLEEVEALPPATIYR